MYFDSTVPFLAVQSVRATMKYILVTGGVISGIGKGIIASSVGTILKSCGLHVTAIKIDPYINIDAGTFSPYEHGMPQLPTWKDDADAVLPGQRMSRSLKVSTELEADGHN